MAVAFVQGVSVDGASVNNITTSAITTTTGNLIVMGAAKNDTQVPTFTDSKSNTWTAGESGSGTNSNCNEGYNTSITGGSSHTFTVTWTNTGYPSLGVIEVSGQAASPRDQHANGNQNNISANPQLSATTGTTTQADEIVLAYLCWNSGANMVYTPQASYSTGTSKSGTNFEHWFGYKVISSTGTQQGSVNIDHPSVSGGCNFISTWKASVAATTPHFLSALGAGK